MIRTIGDRGINWNLYLSGDFNETEKTVHIHYYHRWRLRDTNHPANAEWRNPLTILEDADRKVCGIRLGNIDYLVTNPDNLFCYQDFSHFVPEP